MNYKDVERALERLEPFKHGYSMSASIVTNECGESFYCVYSYTTLIASYDLRMQDWWINEEKYSVTTSKQQNMVCRVASRALELI